MSKWPDFFKRQEDRYSYHANPWRKLPVSEQPLLAIEENLDSAKTKLDYLRRLLTRARMDFQEVTEHAVVEAIQVHDELSACIAKLTRTQAELENWLGIKE